MYIAGLAMVISFFSYCESRKLRKEQGQAFLFADIMQMDSTLYVIVCNIGETFAYDVRITVEEPFVNRFSNLRLLQPGISYRYSLLNSHDFSEYPAELKLTISYHDRYARWKTVKKGFQFNLVDYLKYDVSFDNMHDIYDISKSY